MTDTNKCRICLERGKLKSIFLMHGKSLISNKIMCLANVQIYPNDGLPNKICSKCIRTLEKCLQFIKLCEDSDLELRKLIKLEDNNAEKHLFSYEADMKIKSDEFLDLSSMEVEIGEEPISEQFKANDQVNNKEVEESPETTNSKKTQKQQCFTCGKVMSSRFRLKTHLRTHTGERPYSCAHCNKNFSLAQNLKVHMRVHTGEKPLHCSVCGQSFAHSAGLAAHKRKHTGQMPYRCVLCPRSFRTVGHLQYHIRRHTGEKNFECDSCGRAFITRSDLKQHLFTHTGDRPHVCCVCGLRLSRASHLKRHMQNAHNTQKCCEKHTKKHSEPKDVEEKG